MLRSYILTLYRSLIRHKLFSLLNILGLAVGLAVFTGLTLATDFEFSYDRWIPNAERTYRVSGVMSMAGRPEEVIAPIPGPVLPTLRADFPQIEAGTRVLTADYPVRRGEQNDYEFINFVDSSFFDVFDLPFVAGDGARALAGTTGVVISEAISRKYFGDQQALGQRLTLTLDGTPRDYVIDGVLKDLPDNTHLKLDIVALLDVSVLPQRAEYLGSWNATNYVTYVRLPAATSIDDINAALPAYVQRRAPDSADWLGVRLEPIADLHFKAVEMGAFKPGIDRRFVVILKIVGLLTLLLAIINYVNLSTARAILRAREVGLRKVFGATRGALIVQFITEAVCVSLLSGVIAVALVELCLPFFNSALGAELKLDYLGADGVLALVAPVAVIVGVAAGAYPALIISRFEPAMVLASSRSPGGGKRAALVREILVVVQFAVSITLLICMAVVFAQSDFVRKANLGFKRDGLVTIRPAMSADMALKREPLLEAFQRTPGVTGATVSGRAPGFPGLNISQTFTRPGLQGDGTTLSWEVVGRDYFKVLGIGFAAGRQLQVTNGLDDGPFFLNQPDAFVNMRARNVVINEVAARNLQFDSPDKALNVTLTFNGGPPVTIVGVAKDARYGSPREPVPPIIYFLDSSPGAQVTGMETMIVRYTGDPKVILRDLETAFRSVEPSAPFEASLVEASLTPFYEPEERQSRLITMGALVAALIGSLGLYGLAAFNSTRRTKEIGIRKVLGASTSDVLRLLIGQFLRPVLIANLIAWPVAFILMREWLSGFDQHVDLGVHHFLIASALAAVVALLTVVGQAVRVARADPGAALRYE